MSKISLLIFGDTAECLPLEEDGASELTVELSEVREIPISLGAHIKVARDGAARFVTSRLEDGKYPLSLFLRGRACTVGHIEKRAGIISLLPHSHGYITDISLRERRLEKRVESLEETVKSLGERINGKPLFGLD